jgi:pimeloyl-ACP methyl ester carboxylesterase
VSTGGRLGDAWIRATARASTRAAPAAVGSYLRSWTGDDFHERINGATPPVLVVHGGHDPGCTAERVADTWGRWYADLDVTCIADAGHYPMVEAPVLTAALIERFVTAHAAQPDPTTSTRHQEV